MLQRTQAEDRIGLLRLHVGEGEIKLPFFKIEGHIEVDTFDVLRAPAIEIGHLVPGESPGFELLKCKTAECPGNLYVRIKVLGLAGQGGDFRTYALNAGTAEQVLDGGVEIAQFDVIAASPELAINAHTKAVGFD